MVGTGERVNDIRCNCQGTVIDIPPLCQAPVPYVGNFPLLPAVATYEVGSLPLSV